MLSTGIHQFNPSGAFSSLQLGNLQKLTRPPAHSEEMELPVRGEWTQGLPVCEAHTPGCTGGVQVSRTSSPQGQPWGVRCCPEEPTWQQVMKLSRNQKLGGILQNDTKWSHGGGRFMASCKGTWKVLIGDCFKIQLSWSLRQVFQKKAVTLFSCPHQMFLESSDAPPGPYFQDDQEKEASLSCSKGPGLHMVPLRHQLHPRTREEVGRRRQHFWGKQLPPALWAGSAVGACTTVRWSALPLEALKDPTPRSKFPPADATAAPPPKPTQGARSSGTEEKVFSGSR